MQIFYEIVVLLSCLCVLLANVCVAQSVRHVDCLALQRNCNRTDVDVCATNGQRCKRFPSDCELKAENCNATLATAWNRTASIQCSTIRLNGTGLCACSTDALRRCSNQTVTTGICAHGAVGFRVRQCHLFRTECDLRKARCNGTEWRTIDNRQCRGFRLNQTNPCHCPKLLQCSLNGTQRCVRVSPSTCRLYGSDCDLELRRCDGERLMDANIQHCRAFAVNQTQNCSCPGVLNCQRNDTNICVRNAGDKCQLLNNACDLEQRTCEGHAISRVSPLHCNNFRIGVNNSCSCPSLFNCSSTTSGICLKTAGGCKLLRSQCELEREKCQRNATQTVSPLQCMGFEYGQQRNCSCPNLMTCSRNSTTTCIRTTTGCRLLSNDCEVEELKCRGENITFLPAIQCRSLRPGQNGTCACSKLLNCKSDFSQICTQTGRMCTLLQNHCELELMRCRGEAAQTVPLLQCSGFEYDQQRNCSCPKLLTCSRNSTTTCIRTKTGCRLLRNDCEVEELKCQGENVTVLPALQCRSLRPGNNGTCACPKLLNCQQNSSQVCIHMGRSCKLLRNHCELEQMKCQGEVLNVTNISQCEGFRLGQTQNCSCPALKTCSRNTTTNICVKGSSGCKLMANACDLELAKCKGENWRVQDALQCRDFAVGYVGNCFCPQLETCSRSDNSSVCVESWGQCKHFGSECEFEMAWCNGKGISLADPQRCQGIPRGSTARCKCPALLRCNKRQMVCAQKGKQCKLFRSDCDHRKSLCTGDTWRRTSMNNCCQLRINQISNCTLSPESAICTRAPNQMCRLFATRCELNAVNANLIKRYSLVNRSECKCFGSRRVGRCVQEPTCTVPAGEERKVCARLGNSLKWFKSQCHLLHTNYRTCKNFRPVRVNMCAKMKH